MRQLNDIGTHRRIHQRTTIANEGLQDGLSSPRVEFRSGWSAAVGAGWAWRGAPHAKSI